MLTDTDVAGADTTETSKKQKPNINKNKKTSIKGNI